jgi:hypothetical protein
MARAKKKKKKKKKSNKRLRWTATNEDLGNVESVKDQDMMVVLGQGHHIALACNLQAATAGYLQKVVVSIFFGQIQYRFYGWQYCCFKDDKGFAKSTK